MEKTLKCPNCGRSLANDEMYCYFCEMDVAELKKKGKEKSENTN